MDSNKNRVSDIGHPVRIYCSEYESIHLSAEGQYTWIMPDCQLRYNDFSLTIFSLVRKLAESPAESVASVPVSVLFPNG